ncbi:MAG: cupin domain-containing protein [Acidimicrobiales bacterium]
MQTATVLTEDLARPAAIPTCAPAQTRRRARLAAPLAAMASGILVLGFAANVVIGAQRPASSPSPASPAPATAPADPSAFTVSARDIHVVTQLYAPGEDSGWHSHSGIHAVTVLSGVLSVYDGQCRLQTYEPGRPYVGGQEVHLVRNETGAPIEMAVTYVSPSHGGGPTQRLAPPGCAA